MTKLFWTILIILFGIHCHSQGVKDTLRVGYTIAPPFIIENGENLEGINIWLWERIARDLDLEFELREMEFPQMLLALESGSIDISINPLTITSERNKKMDFTHSYYVSNSTIAVNEVSALRKVAQILKTFFNINFLRIFLILTLIIILFGLITWLFEKKVNQDQFRSGWKGIWDGLWWSVVTVTTVGYGDKAPKSKGGKFVALIWMFTGLFFISILTASVASSLTVDQLRTNPKSFNDFKESPVGTVENTSSLNFLRTQMFKNVHQYKNIDEGLETLLQHNIDAIIYDEPILKYRIKGQIKYDQIEILPTRFNLQHYAFGLPRSNHELKEKISQKILEIAESLEWKIILNEFGLSEI